LAFLLNHILHYTCFKILFTVSKYLVTNWSYTHLIRALKKAKKSNKKFNIFLCLHNPLQSLLHYTEIILGNNGLHSVSNKTNDI